MNAVSPTRSTRTLPGLACWQCAGVTVANASERENKSANVSDFNDSSKWASVRFGPRRTKLRRLTQTMSGLRKKWRECLFALIGYPPPHPPSIIGINSNVVIYINKFGGAMARKRLSETSICQRLPKVVFQQLRNRLWRRTQF